jgi:hypothetical protein
MLKIKLSKPLILILGILILNWISWLPVPGKAETSPQETNETNETIDINPKLIEESPVLQRWLKNIPNVLEEIETDPSFRTRFRLGYSQFPSSGDVGGFNIGVEDVFLGKTGLTLSGDYEGSFNGVRKSVGANLQYYVLPLGNYVNIAPVVGYRYIETNNYTTDGLNLGIKLILPLSRKGAADISVTQSFISPGGDNEVGITNLSVGYAITPHVRLAADIEEQNSRAAKDSRVGIVFDWIP